MAKLTKIENYTLINDPSNPEPVKLVYPDLRRTILVIRAVNHDLRKNIIRILSDNEKLNVTEIYIKLRVEQSVASQHLAILRRTGIVETDRLGKYIHYRLNRERLAEVNALVEAMAG